MCMAKDCGRARSCRRHPLSGARPDPIAQSYVDASRRVGWTAADCELFIAAPSTGRRLVRR